MIRHVLLKLLLILAAFLAASWSAGAMLGVLSVLTGAIVPGDQMHGLSAAIAVGGTVIGLFVAAVTAVPTLFVIVPAEIFGWRRWPAYVGAGAILGALLYAVVESRNVAQPRDYPIYAAAGAVAGLVYWLIAGRKAGDWRTV